ncbi:hypothetical protein PMAN_a2970 [Pseudoalteromonas marina]|nr:hypothetical protein ATW7_09843 [Alteromonadales bacterium TW-7]KAF7778164.1 hypothetical protein PMAN_a2970 [Pseudoalteromonas marina]GAA74321.1 hypothetical protein P20480_0781 [Pseudoalteromonas sp. BSi20480]
MQLVQPSDILNKVKLPFFVKFKTLKNYNSALAYLLANLYCI